MSIKNPKASRALKQALERSAIRQRTCLTKLDPHLPFSGQVVLKMFWRQEEGGPPKEYMRYQ